MHTQVKISVAYGTLQHSFYIFVILLTVALRLHHAGSCTAGTAEQTHVTYTYIDTKEKGKASTVVPEALCNWQPNTPYHGWVLHSSSCFLSGHQNLFLISSLEMLDNLCYWASISQLSYTVWLNFLIGRPSLLIFGFHNHTLAGNIFKLQNT